MIAELFEKIKDVSLDKEVDFTGEQLQVGDNFQKASRDLQERILKMH
ncbi:MAG: hypothetical protein ACJ0QC_07035 [Flavobacteriales bacterium]